MAKPKIAILHYSCPPVIGGVEFIIEAHAREFAKAGYDTKLIVGKGEDVWPGVPSVVLPNISSGGGKLAPVLESIGRGEVPPSLDNAVSQVERELRNELKGVDVCMMHNVLTMHFNLVLTAALANIMADVRGVNFIGWTHDLTFCNPDYERHQIREYPWDLMAKPLEGCRYCVISAQRQQETEEVFGIPASQLPVIPDGIDVPLHWDLPERVRELYHSESLARTDIVVLTPTRILRRKNLAAGMDVIGELKRKGTSVRWLITGAPDVHNPETMKYYRELQDQRRRLGILNEVIFLGERFNGKVSNEELRALYRMADVLLFPSQSEGFGLPVLEAGLSGLVVAISDIPALRELAGENAIYLDLEENNAPAVADDIIEAMKGCPRAQHWKKVVSKYSWETVFSDHIVPAVLTPENIWP